MFAQKKKRQHYVWRRYLTAWVRDNKIACMRNKTHIFSTDLMGVAQQSYFYKIPNLTIDDINFVKQLFLSDVSKPVSTIYERLFSLFSFVEQIDNINIHENNKELSKLKEHYAKNLEEEIQSEIETQGDICLKALLENDTNFFNDEKLSAYFLNFICMQYIRTKNHQEALVNQFQGKDRNRILKCVNLIRIVFSTRLATNLFINRDKYKLVLVKNLSGFDLITSDQPVINFMAHGKSENDTINDFGLYYPISPSQAVFLVEKNIFGETEHIEFNADLVHWYNNMMIQFSYEQVYASSEHQLQATITNKT